MVENCLEPETVHLATVDIAYLKIDCLQSDLYSHYNASLEHLYRKHLGARLHEDCI